MTPCSRCGMAFSAPVGRGGRPRTRCDACRSNLAQIDGATWRKLRAKVLAEEPVCAIEGCGQLSTEVDHILPLQVAPALGLIRSNLRGMCKRHNASKGAKVSFAGSRTVTEGPRAGKQLCRCGDILCPGLRHL